VDEKSKIKATHTQHLVRSHFPTLSMAPLSCLILVKGEDDLVLEDSTFTDQSPVCCLHMFEYFLWFLLLLISSFIPL
jgi:hypothetical protein